MEELLKYIIKNITGIENFEVIKAENEGVTMFTIKVPEEYVGLVIGREGKCIKAIRNLLKVRATLENVRADLNIEPLS
jgi:predicted RNA-binding protein YlqC (UPF0109 family)